MTPGREVPTRRGPEAYGLDPALGSVGLNLAAHLTPARYDALVPAGWQVDRILPGARRIVVIGSAGPGFYRAAAAWGGDPLHPVDAFCEHLLEAEVSRLAVAGHRARVVYYFERRAAEPRAREEFADFVALGHAAGLGARSRLGLLLHAEFGPWFAIRALLLDDRSTPASTVSGELAAEPFDPCCDCPAPCVSACHGGAVTEGNFDAASCVSTRSHEPECRRRCDARLACPIGRAHRYDAAGLAHHMNAPFRGIVDENDPRGGSGATSP